MSADQKELARYEKLLAKAEADSKKACETRGDLPMGASRARMTTLNARWMRAAEHRDRMIQIVEDLRERARTELTIHRPDGETVKVYPSKMWSPTEKPPPAVEKPCEEKENADGCGRCLDSKSCSRHPGEI